MKYYKVYTNGYIPVCYVKTEQNITPEELCEKIECPNYVAALIAEQCWEEFISSKYNDWDLKES